MKVVIHMGLHKTGSTSFQNFLHYNKKSLLSVGILYPDIDNNEDNLEDDAVLLEDETEIDPAADAGIKTPEDGEEEY